ncbi:MAG TPA: thioredoxin domain-containing protein [Gemmatimonadales bacterium]|jgi:protein-disulfide isomerase
MASGQKPFYIALAVVVIGGAAFIVSRMVSTPAISIPANVVVTAADTSGFRGYILGLPSAPVEVAEYADFQCPHCADFDQVQFPDVKARLIDTGKARLRFRDFPIEGDGSRVAAHAAACANDQGKFWQVKEALFQRQADWAFHARPMSVFTEIVKNAGVDVAAWDTCMKSAKYAGRIQASYNEGVKLGVSGTPTFLIGDHLYTGLSSDRMVKIVDSLTALAPPAGGSTAPSLPGQ